MYIPQFDILHALSQAILKLAISSPFKGQEGEVKKSYPEMKPMISKLKHNLIDATCPTDNESPLRYAIFSQGIKK